MIARIPAAPDHDPIDPNISDADLRQYTHGILQRLAKRATAALEEGRDWSQVDDFEALIEELVDAYEMADARDIPQANTEGEA